MGKRLRNAAEPGGQGAFTIKLKVGRNTDTRSAEERAEDEEFCQWAIRGISTLLWPFHLPGWDLL